MTAAVDVAPADHYAIILWDHGSMTGIGADESHSDVLEGWEIAVGLETGLASTGITLDFIGFDACLMASLEVASVVAPYGDLHDRLRGVRADRWLGVRRVRIPGGSRHHRGGPGDLDPGGLHADILAERPHRDAVDARPAASTTSSLPP